MKMSRCPGGGVEYTGVCSECGYATFWSDVAEGEYKYCPNCGVKMVVIE